MISIQGDETREGAGDGADDSSTGIFRALIYFSTGVDDLRSVEGRY